MITFKHAFVTLLASFTALLSTGSFAIANSYYKTGTAAHFKEHPTVRGYEASAKLLFKIGLPRITAVNTTGCTDYDIGCWASREVFKKKQKLKDFVWNLTPDVFPTQKNRREKRQVAVGLGIAAGFLLHSVFSSLSNKLFGTDNEAEHHIRQVWDSVKADQKEFLLFRHEVDMYSQNLSMLVGRNWFTESQVEKYVRNLFYLYQVGDAVNEVELGMSRCVNNLIPPQQINASMLSKSFVAISNQASRHGYMLAVPITHLDSYQKLEIADCFMTDAYMYILLNIPMSRFEYRIFELIPIPFAFNNHTCSLESSTTEIVAVSAGKVKVIDHTFHKFCDLVREKLYYISVFSRPSKISENCAAKIYNKSSIVTLGESCKFKCSSQTELLLFSVDASNLIVTNGKLIRVDCGHDSFSWIPESIGSLELLIRCNCSYYINGNLIDTKGYCVEGIFSMSDAVPSLPHFLMPGTNNGIPFGTNASQNWTRYAPVLNITTVKDSVVDSPIFGIHNDIVLGVHSTVLILVVVFAVVAIFLFIRIYNSKS